MHTVPQEQEWLTRVEGLFLRFGIKSQTMDDISRELGISKKTLYQMVTNKDELVRKVLEQHISREKSQCLADCASAQNAIEEIFLVIETNSKQLSAMKANVLYDLQKYHREGWLLVQNFQYDFVLRVIKENLDRGRREGLYRMDFDSEILAKLHLATVFQLFDEELFPSDEVSKDKVFKEYMMHYLHGIVSEKGLKYLKSKLQH